MDEAPYYAVAFSPITGEGSRPVAVFLNGTARGATGGGRRMTEQHPTHPVVPLRAGKYARIERERRFLLTSPPPASAVVATRRIIDRYLTGTRLRLRRVEHVDTANYEYKLGQKIPADVPGPIQGLITNIYLTRAEYGLLASLPADVLSKTRLSVPPMGIDVFDSRLQGLIMAEAEFTSDATAAAFIPPPYCTAEVSTDPRFTGGRLVRVDADELARWMSEYDISLDLNPTQPI
jgi:CYTH domain-containing protein